MKMVNDETLVSIRALVHYIIENKKDVFFDDAMKILRWLDEARWVDLLRLISGFRFRL